MASLMTKNPLTQPDVAPHSKKGDWMESHGLIIGPDDPILVTGANGFIGSRVVDALLKLGFRNIRCFSRRLDDAARMQTHSAGALNRVQVSVFKGNLLSRDDCRAAAKDVAVVFHLAAGRGEKSYPDAYMNSVVTTRNLLEACVEHRRLKRFVNVSSFSVYSNGRRAGRRVLDESSPVETEPQLRGEAYAFAKAKQDEIVTEYGRRFGIPYVIVRPGYVYGPGNEGISGRVGIGTFGLFLHLGGSNPIPFTYVDNCADAIALAGLKKGVDGEVFNIVDDDLPSSRKFLRLYKKNVQGFRSLYLPHVVSYALCYLWEKYAAWSEGQLPPVFNRKRWTAYWRKTRYTNEKLKTRLGWTPKISTMEGLKLHFESCRARQRHA
jgi:nucleoside-diphosphate-sugar epimerase